MSTGKVLEYKDIKNRKLLLDEADARTRVSIADCYNVTIELARLPVVGMFLYGCHNIKILVHQGHNSRVEMTNCCDVKVDFVEVLGVSLSEFRSKDIYANGHRLDSEWTSSLWKLGGS